MTSKKAIKAAIGRLSLMPYFPAETEALSALGELLEEMCATDEQLEWLSRRMLKLYKQWPGPFELRATLCSKHKPKDGHEVDSEVYPDGIPSERPEEPAVPLLPAAGTQAREFLDGACKKMNRDRIRKQLQNWSVKDRTNTGGK